MLNITAIESAMRKLGLNGTTLAEACHVSKEATSNWLKGESIPRPSKLAKLAEVLELQVDGLLRIFEAPAPVFAYRTKRNAVVSDSARAMAEEQARHLQQLLPYVDDRSEFEPPLMREPSLDDDRIRNAANAVRTSLELSRTAVLTNAKLEALFHTFGAVMVPVLWGLDKEKHENALTVYLPESKTSWVIINLGCKTDDYKYWLAHEYGHCLTLHGMSEDDGELFAERFAQYLVFPDEVAHECLERIRGGGNGTTVVKEYATHYGISAITVLRAVDKLSQQLHGAATGLDNKYFYAGWNATRKNVRSMAFELFGTDTPTNEDYVAKTEQAYKTPVFTAIQAFQVAEGGRNPAFIASVLNVGLGDAVGLSHVLWSRQP